VHEDQGVGIHLAAVTAGVQCREHLRRQWVALGVGAAIQAHE
jgi:hypothetical protein